MSGARLHALLKGSESSKKNFRSLLRPSRSFNVRVHAQSLDAEHKAEINGYEEALEQLEEEHDMMVSSLQLQNGRKLEKNRSLSLHQLWGRALY